MKVIQCDFEEFIEQIENQGTRVICFGVAEMAKEAMAYSDLRKHVIAFADNDEKKAGKEFVFDNRSYPILSPSDLLNIEAENTALLITSSYFKAITEQLQEQLSSIPVKCYAYPLLRLNYEAGGEAFFQHRILEQCMKEYEQVLENLSLSQEERRKCLDEKYRYINGDLTDGKRPLVLPRIMVMPTTRCNMKCRDCSSLLPYFKAPIDLEIEQVIQDIELFTEAIDECIRITVGGEPFLYPKLQELLEYLLKQEKILGILLITNSTILPNQPILDLLKDPKVLVEISDYGHLEKMARTVTAFEENKIHFKVLTEQIWVDMGGTEKRDRSAEELKYVYLNCDQGRVVKALHNGRFHVCGRSARMLALNRYSSQRDYFEISGNDTKEARRKKIWELYTRDSADACDHCDCGAFPGRPIPAGIQIDGSKKKSDYTIVSRQEYEDLKAKSEIK